MAAEVEVATDIILGEPKDPLTDHLAMRAIHKWRFWYLFETDGKPQILYRKRGTRKLPNGTAVTELTIEWGGLDHASMSVEARKMFTDAWNEFREWKEAMR